MMGAPPAHADMRADLSDPSRSADLGASKGEPGQSLRLTFRNVRPETGKIWISLCTEQELPKRDDGGCSGHVTIPASDGAEYVFEGFPAGIYAATAFHDDNDNGALDFDTRGLPAEALGNSRNAVGSFGPPTFEQMKFELAPKATSPEALAITIRMQRIEIP